MNGIRQELLNRRLDEKLFNKTTKYFKFFVILIMNPFSQTNDIGYGRGLIFHGGFLIMIRHEINIIADSCGGSPEEESVNPPSHGVSVLLWIKLLGTFVYEILLVFVILVALGFLLFLFGLGFGFLLGFGLLLWVLFL